MSTDRNTLEQWDKETIWHPFTPMSHWLEEETPIIVGGRGDFLIDIDGRELIDGVSSLWTTVHGHNRPELNQAMKDQIDRIAHTTFLGLTHPPAIELSRRLVDLTPAGLNRVFYSDSGSTAVEVALKIAFQYHQQKAKPEPERTKFMSLEGAYHGDTLGSVSVGGMDLFHQIYKPLLFETLQAPQPYCYHCPLGLEPQTCDSACAAKAEEMIAANASELAAVIVEPLIQGAAGMITQPQGYLKRLAEAARAAGALLIVDEVATGFGRTGSLFASDLAGVSPDLMCLGKGLTGGYLPVAATLATEAVFEAFLAPQWEAKTFFHGHTFTANPIGCAVAVANLDLFETDRTMDRLQPKIARLAELLRPLADRPYVGQIRRQGVMVGIELTADKATHQGLDPTRRLPQAITRRAYDLGAVIRPLGDVMILMPPLAIEPANLDRLVAITGQAIDEVLGA